jgi:membrane protease YdiL (CAAX protease family)
MTAFAAGYIYLSYAENKLGKTNGIVAADQAEMQLRMLSIMQEGLSSVNNAMGWGQPTGKDLTQEQTTRTQALEHAEKALILAIKQNPNSNKLKAKLVVVLGLENKPENLRRIEDLSAEIKAQHKPDQSAPQTERLADLLDDIYVDKYSTTQSIASDAEVISKGFGAGWYANQALEQLYTAAHADDLRKAQQAAVHSRYTKSFRNIILVGLVIAACALVGIVTLFWQAIATATNQQFRQRVATLGLTRALSSPAPEDFQAEAVGLKQGEEVAGSADVGLPLKTIYTVFVAWFSIQIGVSLAFHALLDHFSTLATQPLSVALSTALTYLCANICGPVLIYFLALKPSGLPFWSSLKLQMRTSTSSPPKLIALGFLGVCATIPLIFTGVLIGHVQGSDNPVLGQIMQASTASNIPATLVFYFTLGVMAPFFEEILFRGFLFAGLKTHFGVAPALIGSSVLFAVMHFDRGGLLLLTIIGLVLGYMFERARSLVPSMICHGLWNSGSFTLALLVFSS